MNETGRDDLLRGVLPGAMEVMTAWDLAGVSRGEVLRAVHREHVAPDPRP
jgi:hypothetical protein